jgi:hypothetical protein
MKAATDERPNVSVGDADVALANEIVRVEVGSGVHGMAIGGTDDLDLMGVYIEQKAQLLGLMPTSEHYVSRTVPEGVRSGPGDVDLTIYSLRKYLRLAVAGNPTVLALLYAPESAVQLMTPLGEGLRALAPAIISKRAGYRFLGYLDGQRDRMLGVGPRQNRVPNRPELIERYGYDVKYASHALRLGLQGIEVVTTGRLSLPMPVDDLARAMTVKRGEVGQAEALRQIDDVRAELAAALEGPSPLRDDPNLDAVNDWMIRAHESHWADA